jgi:hypothetical protein
MAGKRKPSRATARTDRTPAPPVDWKGRPPMICTLGSDLEESRRLQERLEQLRQRTRQGMV